MCNLSKGVEDRGIRIGISQGITIGAERTRLGDIQNLMETLKLTAAQAMAALKIPESEQEKYSSLLHL